MRTVNFFNHNSVCYYDDDDDEGLVYFQPEELLARLGRSFRETCWDDKKSSLSFEVFINNKSFCVQSFPHRFNDNFNGLYLLANLGLNLNDFAKEKFEVYTYKRSVEVRIKGNSYKVVCR